MTTTTRLAALLAALALTLAACGSSGSAEVASLSETGGAGTDVAEDAATTTDDASDEEAILAFSACMREHGIEDFEDPDIGADGSISFGLRGQAGGEFDREAMQAAMDACRSHLDGLALARGGGDRTEIEDQLYELAACMRDNGYDMPDPDFGSEPGSGGGPFGELDPEDPAFQAALETCEDVFGAGFRLGPPPGGGRGADG